MNNKSFINFFEDRENLNNDDFNKYLSGGFKYKIDGGFPIVDFTTEDNVDSPKAREFISNNKIKDILNNRRENNPYFNINKNNDNVVKVNDDIFTLENNNINNDINNEKNTNVLKQDIKIVNNQSGGNIETDSIQLPQEIKIVNNQSGGNIETDSIQLPQEIKIIDH